MSAFGFELRQAARRVFTWKQTGAVMIPAIGLALATIMFAVGWGYSSLSLPYKDAGQLVMVGYDTPGANDSYGYLDWKYEPLFEWMERKDVFTDVAAERRGDMPVGMTFKTGNGVVDLDIREVTINYFDVLGLSFPGIQAWKEAANAKNPMTVVFTHKTGANKFGYDSIGKLFPSEDGGNGIVAGGILPENFTLLTFWYSRGDSEKAFAPMELKPGDATSRMTPDGNVYYSSTDWLYVYVRLAPGITPQLAEQMLSNTSGGNHTNFYGKKMQLRVKPIVDRIAAQSKPIVRYAWALCALILLLCAANLGGLILTRCTYRLREYAMRSALGATLFNLVRALMLELFGIAVLAALIAGYIARIAMPYIADRVPIEHEAFGRPIFEWQAVVFLITATAAVMFASAAPAVLALVRNYYKGFSQGIFAVFHSHRTMRITLTACQTAIATLLLCISWMTVRGYSDIFFRDTGVDADVRVISVRYPSLKQTGVVTLFGSEEPPPPFNVLDTLSAFRGGNPNARAAVFAAENLFKDRSTLARHLAAEKESREIRGIANMENRSFEMFRVSPGFFQTLDVKIIAGRDFNDTDLPERELIVNEALVRKMGWTTWEAVGRETSYPIGYNNRFGTIIGVVSDFQTGSLDSEILPEFYTPIDRDGMRWHLPVHYIVHPDDLRRAGSIERIIRSFDHDAMITQNVSWDAGLGATDRVRGRSFATFSITLFTIAAIAIVVIGIVSTITFIVARRTRDIAIQIAVGAPPTRVCWFVMKDMVIAGVIGALIGGIASWWAGKAVAHYIYNGEKYQNLTGLAIATVIMLAIIAAASLLPALRAIRIEPGRILNSE